MKFRVVYTDFWRDPVIMEEMTPEDRFFYLYLLTNPNTTSTGIYTTTKKLMALDLGYSVETLEILMDRFINHHKLIRYNTETRELALKNWGKYNLGRGGKPVMDCLTKELSLVKDKSLIQYIAQNIKNEAMLKLYESFFEESTTSERIVVPEGGIKNKEKEINKQKEIEREININTEIDDIAVVNINQSNKDSSVGQNENIVVSDNFSLYLDEAAQSLSNYYRAITGSEEGLDLKTLKLLIKQHKAINVKYAIFKATASKKYAISYISGILRNWKKEGYPRCEDDLVRQSAQKQSGKQLKFTDYPQRQYDYDRLEKKLLGWDTKN